MILLIDSNYVRNSLQVHSKRYPGDTKERRSTRYSANVQESNINDWTTIDRSVERLTVGDSALSSRACTHVSLTTEGRFDSSSLERDSRCNRFARSSNGDGEKKRKWRRRMVNGKFQYWIWWKRVNAEVKHRAILLPGPRKREREREKTAKRRKIRRSD